VMLDEVERRGDGIPSLRLARTTGEPLRPQTAERWRRVFPQVPLVNVYGATECSGSLACDTSAMRTSGARRIPVGAPVPGVQVLVLSDDMRVLRPGAAGDVCIGGASLARGYLGRPAMTAERFVPSPRANAGERVFRTGDSGFWRPDGRLEVTGRRDLQVKVRGFRVEIEAVEAALRACPGVSAAAVRAEGEESGVRLVALLESRLDPLGAREIREALHRKLPAYMVPAELFRVDRLPRTSSGKIDRPALARLPRRPLEPLPCCAAPSTSSEEAVAAIWEHVLGIRSVGVEDDFFALGGHSLAGMKIMARVHTTFGVELPLAALFDAQTVKGLACEIDNARRLRDFTTMA
jgi:acyl-coenzyme A synthetase/AMP-(fatty) acid ligase